MSNPLADSQDRKVRGTTSLEPAHKILVQICVGTLPQLGGSINMGWRSIHQRSTRLRTGWIMPGLGMCRPVRGCYEVAQVLSPRESRM